MSESTIKVDPVTSRYAEALFSLAARKGMLEAVQEDVRKIGAELSNPAVARYLFDARVDMQKRRATLGPLVDGLSELTQNFVNLLFDKRREEVLEGLASAFHRRSLAERRAAEGVVESARALDPAEVERLCAKLGATLGKTVTLENRLAPDLVGGVRVTVENRMIDFSVRGRLDGLQRQLMGAALPSPQG